MIAPDNVFSTSLTEINMAKIMMKMAMSRRVHLRLSASFVTLALITALITVQAAAEDAARDTAKATSRANVDETMRVLCYNIHYGQGTDGQYDVERLAKVISQSQADFVALQEVDVGVDRSGRVHQAGRLGELTGMAVRFGPTQHYQGGLFGNAILTKHDIIDVSIHPLPYTESTPERTTYPRGAIAVTVRTPGGQLLRLISTHFQHNVPEDRIAEAKAINDLFAGDDGPPTILCGDMNATPQEEPIKILLQKWSVAIEQQPAPSAPATQPRSRIDYIFFRPSDRFRLVDTKVIDEPLASDHRPVFAELELRSASDK